MILDLNKLNVLDIDTYPYKLKYYIFTKLNQNKYINIDNKKLFKLYEQSLQNKNHGFSLIDKNNKKIQLSYLSIKHRKTYHFREM